MFPEKCWTDDRVGCFGHDDEGLFERVVADFELQGVCRASFFEFGVGILYSESGGGAFAIMAALVSFCILSASFSLMTLMSAPESTSASILVFLKSRGMKSILLFFLRVIADINGK